VVVDRRSYHQYCGLARALDLVGERWTLLVIRNLLLGPQRYGELQRGLPGITTNLLAKRLKEMETLELIERFLPAGEDSAHAYRLAPRGAALEPVIHALSTWGWQRMGAPARDEYRSVDFLMVALRRRYRGGQSLRAEVVADGTPYRVILDGARADISRGELPRPDVRIRATGAALVKLFLDAHAKKDPWKAIEYDGTRDDVRAVLGAFATSDAEPGRASRSA
jgi:DNA-binding HxlR family transcriptional regulator